MNICPLFNLLTRNKDGSGWFVRNNHSVIVVGPGILLSRNDSGCGNLSDYLHVESTIKELAINFLNLRMVEVR